MQTGRFVCARVCMYESVCVSALVSVCVYLYLVCMLCAYIDAYREGKWGGDGGERYYLFWCMIARSPLC